MAQEKFYVVTKNKYDDRTIKIDSGKMNGFKITPKNEITYDGTNKHLTNELIDNMNESLFN